MRSAGPFLGNRIRGSILGPRATAGFADLIPLLLLVAAAFYLTRPLFDWNTRVIDSDIGGSWAWLYWLKESLFTFHQWPNWSPLWMSGMPFFGMVPPGGLLFTLPLLPITGNIPAAFNLGVIIVFCLAGVGMYLYLRHLSERRLISFLGAIIYLVLPIHIGGMMFWGLYEILCAYAVSPLVLLFVDRFLDGKGGINLLLASICLSFVLLSQIEYAFLFLVFFMLPYLAFALASKRVGISALLNLFRASRVCTVLAVLFMLLPLSFYISVLTERAEFAGLSPAQVDYGLHHWAFEHFSEAFSAKANNWLDIWSDPSTEYYSSPLSFVIILASSFLVAVGRLTEHRARLLFFLVLATGFLVLSMGIHGPLLPVLRAVIPWLGEMRAPLRFYYFFAICLPVLFTLSCMAGSSLAGRRLASSPQRLQLLKTAVPVVIVIGLVLDFLPYFDIYHVRVLNKDAYTQISSFLERRISEDGQPANQVCRIYTFPAGGMQFDRLAEIKQAGGEQFTIEVSQSWLPWNQYVAAFNYDPPVYGRIIQEPLFLDFYSDVLSYDYVLMYVDALNPLSTVDWYAGEMDRTVQTLNMYCTGESPILVKRGSLETQYYTVYLYRINRDVLGKTRFSALDDSVVLWDVPAGDMLASQALTRLWELYRVVNSVSGAVTPRDFLTRMISVSGDDGLLTRTSPDGESVAGLIDYEGEVLLVPDDPAAVRLLEAEDCETSTWAAVDRESLSGIRTSGFDMAIGDVTQAQDNCITGTFSIGSAADWLLSISYFASLDTGLVDVYIDGAFLATIDTYSLATTIKTYSAEVSLSRGQHQIRLAGRPSDREIDQGAGGKWAEVDRITLLNREELPRLVSQSRDIWNRIAEARVTESVLGRTIEAEDCQTNGWVTVDRESCCGVPTSGYGMVIPDVTQAEENYLGQSFMVTTAGNWTLDIIYLSHVDTGMMEVYLDDVLIDTVDTFSWQSPRGTYSTSFYLTAGLHRIKIVGRRSNRNITVGMMGNWVEIDYMVLQSQDQAPETPRTQETAQVSGFTLSPKGVSLDIETARDGIVSIAYSSNPWWRVYVDGAKSKLLTVDGLFPGCYVESGQHHVEFVCRYPSLANLFSLLPT